MTITSSGSAAGRASKQTTGQDAAGERTEEHKQNRKPFQQSLFYMPMSCTSAAFAIARCAMLWRNSQHLCCTTL